MPTVSAEELNKASQEDVATTTHKGQKKEKCRAAGCDHFHFLFLGSSWLHVYSRMKSPRVVKIWMDSSTKGTNEPSRAQLPGWI